MQAGLSSTRFGAAGDGGKQRQRIEPPVDEQRRRTTPNPSAARPDRVGELEQVAVVQSPTSTPRLDSVTPNFIARGPLDHGHEVALHQHVRLHRHFHDPAPGRDAGSGNIFTHSSLMGLRCNSFTQNVTFDDVLDPGAAGLDRAAQVREHEFTLLSTAGERLGVGSTPRINPER